MNFSHRVRKRLAMWKNKCITFGGRICLIKSVRSSIPVYYLSSYKAPISVVKCGRRILKNFLWGENGEKNKISWISWENFCRSKKEGGLGVKDWGKFNLALLGKWRWRLLTEKDSLWAKIILSKYSRPNPAKAFIWWQDLR